MIQLRLRALVRERVFRHSLQQIFAGMYRRNSWANPESVSGNGSDLAQTRTVRHELARLVSELGVRSLLDAPCGDYHWMREVSLALDAYIGADIVPELIAENARRYAGPGIGFRVLDVCKDPLPNVDLILCRDCLVHLPLPSAMAAIANFRRSGSRYLLTTTYPGLLERNRSLLITGNWRPLDLCLPPFSLPEPLRIINEECTEADDFPQKSLGLWELEVADVWASDGAAPRSRA